jgi:hypothetical protein
MASSLESAVAPPKKDTQQVTLRIPTEWLAKADELAKRLAPPGADFGRTDALRAAIAKGFEWFELEAEEEQPRAKAKPAKAKR